MRRQFLPLCQDRSGAAAEMALVTPLLLIIMFGSLEMGNYFLDNHIVAKAVRDGARYAGRLSFTNYPCTSASTGNTPGGTVVDDTRNVTRTEQVASGGSPRLYNWTDGTTITVNYDCVNPAAASPSYTGIYNGMSYLPVVKVSASVTYPSLFAKFGLISTGTFSLAAASQATVDGI